MENQEFNQGEHVKRYMERPWFYINGLDIRVFSAMGDRVAATISAELDPAKLNDEFFLQKALAAVYASFEHPDCIERDADRFPIATTNLLRKLMIGAQSAGQRDRIMKILETLGKGF